MIRLLRVELRRLASRRLVRRSVVILFAGILLTPVLVPWAFEQQARIQHDADIERCVQARPPKTRDGVTMPTIPPEVAAPGERDRLCREVTPEISPDFELRDLDQVFRATAPLLVIVAFLIGASSIGADWQAGLVPTVLTWESRRRRVFGARLAALVLPTFLAIALWHALLAAAVVPSALLDDTTNDTGWEWLRSISGLGLRIAAVGAAAAAFGYALAMIGRSSAAALGIGFAYLFVFENVVGSQFKPLRPWLMVWNALVFVKGTFAAGGDVPDRTVLAAAVILAVYAVAILAAAATTFARRDAS
jgi:hypothetical protein